MEKRFYVCKHCGNMVGMIKNAGVPIICCGEPMAELTANTVEASQEKHLPVYTMDGGVLKVQVGSAEHPMLAEHYIEWIYVETEQGGQRKALKPGDKPSAEFAFAGGDKPVAVYAYCNLHGLWKTEVK